MKKYFWAFSLLLVCTLAIIYGCKKTIKEEQVVKPAESGVSGSVNHDAAMEDITVSSYGFLIFPTTADLDEYLKFCTSSTHAQVQEYLSEKTFSSLGATLYGEEYLSQTVTDEQAMNYVFDTHRIFQVEGTIMKPIVPWTSCPAVGWQFMLAMIPENLNSTSHDYLMADTYDSNTMDKFSTNSEPTGGLFDFVKNNPTGYEDTDTTSCPPDSVASERRFFGTGWNVHIPSTAPFQGSVDGCPCGGWVGTKEYTILFIPTGITGVGVKCKKGCL